MWRKEPSQSPAYNASIAHMWRLISAAFVEASQVFELYQVNNSWGVG